VTDHAATEIQRLDDERTEALLTNNYEKLGKLLADDLVHIHANGSVEDKPSYLAGISKNLEFLKITRPPLEIRIIGEAAVATGLLNQTVRVRQSGAVMEMQAMATQVWVRCDGAWLQNNFQATRIG
jgi:hypothetical protein